MNQLEDFTQNKPSDKTQILKLKTKKNFHQTSFVLYLPKI